MLHVAALAFASLVAAPQSVTVKDSAGSVIEVTDKADGLEVTQHKLVIDGVELAYTARAGRMKLATEDGKPKADLFFVAYTKDGVEDLAQRPIMFSFNGGPGSSSVWLHLGALGPRRVVLEREGWAPPPPYALEDNAHSWLDATDLVFIDPVTTGYSRAATGEDDAQFHGVRSDVEWVGEFIRLYTSKYERWASPKFLAGESYGTTRAAKLADYLQERHGMYLNGIVLISAILNFGTTEFDSGNELPYALFLPTYAATAWYHKRVAPELQGDLRKLLDEVERFTLDDYLPALARGDALSEPERKQIGAKLARYTGLSLDYLVSCDLRIQDGRFCKELLRSERRSVGRLDSRFLGIDRDAAGESSDYDPSYAAIQGPFTATLNDYVRRELGYESDLPYEILTGRVHPWKFDEKNSYLDVSRDLRDAMTHNPALKVFVAAGYYDFATPYFAAEYTLRHMRLDPTLRGNVTLAHYASGHMMYIHQDELVRLKHDVRAFVTGAIAR